MKEDEAAESPNQGDVGSLTGLERLRSGEYPLSVAYSMPSSHVTDTLSTLHRMGSSKS